MSAGVADGGRAPSGAVAASRRIDAPADRVYSIIADYEVGHPSILPKPPFVFLEVEEGGRGAGTRIRVGMRALGSVRPFRAVVSEPEPGRRLVETNDTGYVTTFLVDPTEEGSSTVTISTTVPGGAGLRGAFERWLAPRMLRPVFERELELLADVATRQ